MGKRVDNLQEKLKDLTIPKANNSGIFPIFYEKGNPQEIVKVLEDNTRSHMENLNQVMEAQIQIIKQLKALEIAMAKKKSGALSTGKNSSFQTEELKV